MDFGLLGRSGPLLPSPDRIVELNDGQMIVEREPFFVGKRYVSLK